MKYTKNILINKPVEEVVQLLNSEENLYKWMEGLQSIYTLEGSQRRKGTKNKMTFKHGKREMDMIETILENDLPNRMVVTYESKGVNNIIFTSLEEVNGKTNYISTQEFKLYGLMKIVAFLAPGIFKKQTMKILNSFKSFAETN